jgi:hypothetical protein
VDEERLAMRCSTGEVDLQTSTAPPFIGTSPGWLGGVNIGSHFRENRS